MTPIIEYDQDQLEALEALLSRHAGEDTIVSGTAGGCHPDAAIFYNDSPDPDFKGFARHEKAASLLFETNLVLTEDVDSHRVRIERLGEYLILSQADEDSAGVYSVTGEVLHSVDDSQDFIDGAIFECCKRAMEPLRGVLGSFDGPGIKLSDAVKQRLVWDFVKTVSAL